MAIDNSRHIQRQELIEVLKMILTEDKGMKDAGFVGLNKDDVLRMIKEIGLRDDLTDGLYITDKNGNIGLQFTETGLDYVGKGETLSRFYGKKLISLGDSLSAGYKWQKYLVDWLGVTFDNDENINGKDGHAAMAIGGTSVLPIQVNSIYMRALDVKYYNPDIIVVYAGQNDLPHFGGYNNDTQTETISEEAIGTINDIPYRHKQLFTDVVNHDDYTYVFNNYRPTVYSYMSGMIENLVVDNPKALIYIVTPMQLMDNSKTIIKRKRLRQIWMDIGEKYGIKVIDLWGRSGVNELNASLYYPNANDVHPIDAGNERIAMTICQEIGGMK